MVLKLCGPARNIVFGTPTAAWKGHQDLVTPSCLIPLGWRPRLRIWTYSCVRHSKEESTTWLPPEGEPTPVAGIVSHMRHECTFHAFRAGCCHRSLQSKQKTATLLGLQDKVDGCFCVCLLKHVSRCGRIHSEVCLHFDILLGKQT